MIYQIYKQSFPTLSSFTVKRILGLRADVTWVQKLQQAIAKLPAAQRENAEEALRTLLRFDGNLHADSPPAAVWGGFLHSYAIDTFGDELGPRDGQTWQAFMASNDASYGAINDHLRGREDSPFWDDNRTPQQETRADTRARAFAGASPGCGREGRRA